MNVGTMGGAPLYSWDVAGGAGGVSGDPEAAIRQMRRELEQATPGARGNVRRVAVSASGRVEYLELGVLVEGRRDALTGGVVWVR
jgi:hypothetical protein